MKNLIVKVLTFNFVSFVVFSAISIDNIGHPTYNKVFIPFAIIAFVSAIILTKINGFEE